MNKPSATTPLERAIRVFHASETTALVVLSIAVGIGAGLGAVAFRWLIASFQIVFFDGGHQLLSFLGRYYVILIPAAGGLLVGLLVYYLASEAKGHGVPEVMLAVTKQGGRIRPRVAIVKSLASAICIGSGGSAGREGPIVQIGSALGSTLGQILKLPEQRVRLLVACGAAGGIAATFNAPIGGVIFALEVILREFSTRSFGLVVLSSVMATVISRAFLGNFPAFRVPEHSLVSAWELPLYILLGILAAGVALALVRILYGLEDIFDGWKVPEYLKPAVGGLLVGIMGVWLPQVFGVGYESIEQALWGQGELTVLALLLALLVGKLVATSLTIGSGGSGGVFAPSLFMGCMLGAAFGYAVNAWLPDITAHPGAYAMVGMAAVFAGAARAPITSVLILFEMTDDYRIILPLMTAVVVSTLLTERLSRDTIYTLKLRRRGIDILARPQVNLMDDITVEEAMSRSFQSVNPGMSVKELMKRFNETGYHNFPVVDDRGELTGIVSLSDAQEAALDQELHLTVDDISTKSVLTCFPDQTLNQALRQFGARDVGGLPVVDRINSKRVVGMLRRSEIISTYGKALAEQTEARNQADRMRISVTGTRCLQFTVSRDSALANRKVKDLGLPSHCILVSIRRDNQVIIPRGDTVIKVGDQVAALAAFGDEEELRRILLQEI